MNWPELTDALRAQIAAAAARLNQGGVVIYPTETFYGLGAALSSPQALTRLASLKGRDPSRPMPVIAPDADSARALWREIPTAAETLMARFWPGPLTLVLPARPGLPREVAPSGEIGIRVSSHPVARELARLAGPIAATSANPSGGPECTRLVQMDPTILSLVDASIDAGETPGGRASTVLRFADGKPQILRQGAIQATLIHACMP